MEPAADPDRPRGLFQCTECKRSYTRVDHLARHVRSHLQEKPFQCDVCHKGFGRPDLLKRHATCHDGDGSAKRQKRTLTQCSRVSQACRSCAFAKLKCEDEKPCKRCQTKGIACESNPDSRAHGASALNRHPMPSADAGPPPAASEADQNNNNQMPTPTTLLNAFEISGDEGSIADSRLTNFTPAMHADPNAAPQPIHFQDNYFTDFLRNVLTPNNAAAFSPAHWQDFEPRNVLDFTVEDDLAFDATDFGLLDAFNGKPFNPNEPFGPPTSELNQPTYGAPAEPPPPDDGPPDNRPRVALGTEAYKRSSFVRWQPAHEGSQLEVGNISAPRNDAASPDARYKVDQHILTERLDQSARDQLLAVILNACDQSNVGRVVASFPTTELLDDLLQCFFARQGSQLDSFIHVPTFSPNSHNPELLGAMVAAGAVLTDIKALQKLGYAIQEASRIALVDRIEKRNATTRELWALQAFMLLVEVFLWSGNKRKMEIAESQQQPLWTMLRRANRFKRPRSPPVVPLPGDTGDALHRKWLAWVERESFRRLALHGFLHDAQSSMSLLVNPIISYGELSLPFPESRELWAAETAEQWKQLYLARPQPSTHERQTCLLDCLKDPKLLASIPTHHDANFSALIVLHGIWGLVWEFNQLQLTMKTKSGTYNSSLVMTHRHQELCQTLQHLRSSMSSWPVAPSPEATLLLEVQLLYLHMSMEDIQLFAGKEDQDEARRVFPALQQWMCDSHARTAVWQAGRVLRAAKAFARKKLRNYYAIAVYHAALALWTYGVIKHATTAHVGPVAAPAAIDPDLSTVWLEGPETSDVQRFIALGRGRPAVSARGPSPDAAELIPLSQPEAAMNVVLESMRNNFTATAAGAADAAVAEQEGVLPPLVENLVQLMRDLGMAAAALH